MTRLSNRGAGWRCADELVQQLSDLVQEVVCVGHLSVHESCQTSRLSLDCDASSDEVVVTNAKSKEANESEIVEHVLTIALPYIGRSLSMA